MQKGKRVYVFIDAANLREIQKAKGKVFDYKKLKNYLCSRYKPKLLQIFYYAAYPKEGTRSYSLDAKHKFFAHLTKKIGIKVRKKPLKIITIQTSLGRTTLEKGNMDVELVIDAVANKDDYDIAVLFTGDSDFLSLVEYLQSDGKLVYAYSSSRNISKELRLNCDGYTDLLKSDAYIWGKAI